MSEISTDPPIPTSILSATPPLPGRMEFIDRDSGASYGYYVKNTYVKDGKVCHDKVYLGRAIDKAKGIFNRPNFGRFQFTLDGGYSWIDPAHQEVMQITQSLVLHLGDVWMIDHTLKTSGLDNILESLIPDSSDTLKALVAYRLIHNGEGFNFASEWYRKSFGRVIYPQASLDSPRISEFLANIGQEKYYRIFFENYIKLITKDDSVGGKVAIAMILDSVGLENVIKTHLTAVSNHCGHVANEMRVIYVVDKKTKLPLYFRYVPGNIIDKSTLISTINMLNTYFIDIELIIMDAGYFSKHNIEQLCLNNIPFLTRMSKNVLEYKRLMEEHGKDLSLPDYAIKYGQRALCGKVVPCHLYGHDLYAYLMLDFQQEYEDKVKGVLKYEQEEDKLVKIAKTFESAGKFVLLSSNKYDITEILPLYYARQTIEQVFDIGKTYAGLMPLRVHSEETIRGVLLITFLATAVYTLISGKLAESPYSPHGAFIHMHNLLIKIYEHTKVIEDLTKQQKEVCSLLNIEFPYMLESENPLQKPAFSPILEKRKRGRPKRTEAQTNQGLGNESGLNTEERRKRGRPKGAKNKVQKEPNSKPSQTEGEKRKRGRPKGAKNKVQKEPKPNSTQAQGEKRQRGRPKGAKNKVQKEPKPKPQAQGEKRKRGRPKGAKNKVQKEPRPEPS